MSDTVLPVADPDTAHPIATAWRPLFAHVIDALVRRDPAALHDLPWLVPVPSTAFARMLEAIDAYGETLVPLDARTWETSVAQWMGDHWDVLVALWTAESGCSDLVLDARVFDGDDGVSIELYLVYVP